ncbi:MAG: transposase [Campylobacterota bacterium]|nr:transposase [Campylobacterota bacterium]
MKLLNIRDNENHQLSRYIVNNYDFISMENLTIKGMQKLWGHKIKNLQLSKFVNQCKYKSENQGKIFIQIDKWYASSKLCSNCKNYNKDLKLEDRIYQCKKCNLTIDRDLNAAINILLEGIRLYLSDIDNYNNDNLYLPIDLWKRITSAINQLISSDVSARDFELSHYCNNDLDDKLLTAI